jgi:multicomponent Na+:H+ antiporter subunit F
MDILELAVDISFILVMLGVAFGFLRLIKGPSLPDRIVALDLMTVLIVAFCGLFAISTDSAAFLDVAIVLALVGFATVALARYVERREDRSDEDELPDPEEEA